MIIFPSCKINLGLKILRKRPDGFHDLATLFYPIPLCDALEVALGNDINNLGAAILNNGLTIDGDTENNLVYKAYKLLQHDYFLPPLTFCLLKNIPMGAGLGGGSSDGAFAIRLLDAYFNLEIPKTKQLAYAAELGSDCSFFIQDLPCIGSGRGEILEPFDLSLKNYWIAIVKPDIHISTAEAFKGIVPEEFQSGLSLTQILSQPIESWKNSLFNDFEKSIFPNHPKLQKIKEDLYQSGAVYAAMSGSGAAIFGLFLAEPNLKSHFKDYFYWEAQLN
jgi:4-diphosphocytidyl-2-C-methyl-D-erythritol kinase